MSGSTYGSAASALAPIMIGLRTPDPDAVLLRRCWQVALLSIPSTWLPGDDGRTHTMVATADRTWVRLAKLVEIEHGEPAWASHRWRWLIGARVVGPRRFGEPFARCPAVYRIETLSYRLRDGALEQAPQLALFRHVLVSGLRASRPDLVVAGGQHSWHDSWWAAAG